MKRASEQVSAAEHASKASCRASEQVSGASKQANGRASGPVSVCIFGCSGPQCILKKKTVKNSWMFFFILIFLQSALTLKQNRKDSAGTQGESEWLNGMVGW